MSKQKLTVIFEENEKRRCGNLNRQYLIEEIAKIRRKYTCNSGGELDSLLKIFKLSQSVEISIPKDRKIPYLITYHLENGDTNVLAGSEVTIEEMLQNILTTGCFEDELVIIPETVEFLWNHHGEMQKKVYDRVELEKIFNQYVMYNPEDNGPAKKLSSVIKYITTIKIDYNEQDSNSLQVVETGIEYQTLTSKVWKKIPVFMLNPLWKELMNMCKK